MRVISIKRVVNIVLIAMAMNGDSIVICWRDQFFFFSIQKNIGFSIINLNLTWPWLGIWLASIKVKKTALIGLKKAFILFEGWMSKVHMLYARYKKAYVLNASKSDLFSLYFEVGIRGGVTSLFYEFECAERNLVTLNETRLFRGRIHLTWCRIVLLYEF